MEINGKQYTIGADPEIFMGQGGKFVSAHDAIPGTKVKPHIVDKGAVQVDGMALEFNIDPASSYKEFEENLDTVQSILKGMIGDMDFLTTPSVMFDEEFASHIPAKALVLGCSADYDSWDQCEATKPDQTELMRTAGGHVHIGGIVPDTNPFHPKHFLEMARLGRLLDHTLGVYSILWDKDDKRRAMYGKAGSFRPKKYGMEYRTLSNAWLFNKDLVKFVYDQVETAIRMWDEGSDADPNIRDIINNSDRDNEFFVNNATAERVMGVV